MTNRISTGFLAVVFAGAASFAIAGCDKSTTSPAPSATTAVPTTGHGTTNEKHGSKHGEEPGHKKEEHGHKKDDDHAHKSGPHGGKIVSIGSDNYHAEAVLEKGGELRLYTLGKDEVKVLEVESKPLTAYVKPEGTVEPTQVVLNPKAQPDDKKGMTSLFVGNLPKEIWGKHIEVSIPMFQVGGERFRIVFKVEPSSK